MKKSKFTEEQIAFALHQAQTGVSVEEVRRRSICRILCSRPVHIVGGGHITRASHSRREVCEACSHCDTYIHAIHLDMINTLAHHAYA
jgi:hypothetical protein